MDWLGFKANESGGDARKNNACADRYLDGAVGQTALLGRCFGVARLQRPRGGQRAEGDSEGEGIQASTPSLLVDSNIEASPRDVARVCVNRTVASLLTLAAAFPHHPLDDDDRQERAPASGDVRAVRLEHPSLPAARSLTTDERFPSCRRVLAKAFGSCRGGRGD